MDAVKFIKEYHRLCKSQDDCYRDCPLLSVGCLHEDKFYDAEKTVAIVEKWSAEHPEKPMWKQVDEECARYRCTNCGAASPYDVRGLSYTPNFCSKCGSEMHGVIELKKEIPWNDCKNCRYHDDCNWEDRMDRCYNLRDGKGDCFTMKE